MRNDNGLERSSKEAPRGDYSRRNAATFVLLWTVPPLAIVLIGVLPLPVDMRAYVLPVVIVLLCGSVIAIINLVALVASLCDGRWAAAGVFLLMAFAYALPIIHPGPLQDIYYDTWGNVLYANNVLCFKTLKSSYDRAVAKTSADQNLRLFVWHDDFEGGTGVVYDPKRILLNHPDGGRATVNLSAYFRETRRLCSAIPVGSNYYLVSYGC